MSLMTLLRLLLACVSLTQAHTKLTEDMCVCGDLRLITDKKTDLTIEGSVQYCYNGVWSEVCRSDPSQPGSSRANYEWELNEATVACRQLGYSDQGAGHMTHCNTSRSDSTASITLNCSDGTESSLHHCNPQLVINSICSCTDGVLEPHAKVVCKKVCSDGEMRLVEGSTHREGIVEVCVDGRWGTVSNNSHGMAGPGDVCNKLGFPAEGAVTITSRPEMFSAYTRGEFICNSNTCPKSCCDISESPGLEVRCLSHENVVSKDSFCVGSQEGQVRLVNGSSSNEGRVNVCINGGWRPVCANEQNTSAFAKSICLALGFSEEDPILRSSESGKDESLCCSSNNSNKFLCEQCSCCNHTIRVECLACQQGVQQVAPSMYPQSEWLPPVTINKGEESSQSLECTSATPVGVVSGVLVTLLVATVVGWIVTCVVWRRSVTLKHRKFLNFSVPDPCTAVCRSDQSHPIQLLDDDIYSVPTLPTPASINCTSVDPNYDMITRERLDTYEAIDHNEHNSNPQHVQVVNPTPVRDEASKKEDDFYDAEEHTIQL